MVACGATASAGPEVAVKGLAQAIVAQDHAAVIEAGQSAARTSAMGVGSVAGH